MILEYKNSTIHYTVKGKGPAVILLHGFLEDVNMWNNLVPEISLNHKVVCIDLLGHGETGCLGYIHTMEAMAEAVFAVIEHLNIKTAHFVGHSMGGYVALALAEKQPQLIKGLCLMNSTFEADDDERKLIRSRANKMAQTNFKALVSMSFANLFAPESKETYKKEYENALQIARQTSVHGYIAAQEGMKLRINRFETFKNLNNEKLIIIGKKDLVVDGKKLIHIIKGTTINYNEFSGGHMRMEKNLFI